jgi:hypothetical protein
MVFIILTPGDGKKGAEAGSKNKNAVPELAKPNPRKLARLQKK